MIQTIGLMLAAYILTRCAEIEQNPRRIVKFHAVLTYLFTLLCVLALLAVDLPAPPR